METFFDMILQAQRNTRAKQFRKDSLRAVLAIMGGQRDVVDNLMAKFLAIVNFIRENNGLKQIEDTSGDIVMSRPGNDINEDTLVFWGVPIKKKDMTVILKVLEWLYQVGASGAKKDFKGIGTYIHYGKELYEVYPLCYLCGDYMTIKSARDSKVIRAVIGSLVKKGDAIDFVEVELENGNHKYYISLMKFKTEFIDKVSIILVLDRL